MPPNDQEPRKRGSWCSGRERDNNRNNVVGANLDDLMGVARKDETDKYTLYLGDAIETMSGIESESVHAIITDPPYAIPKGASFWKRGGDIEDGSGGWNEMKNPFGWIPEAARILAPGGHIVSFLDQAQIRECWTIAESVGLQRWHMFSIVKSAPPPTPRPTFVSAIEMALVFEKRDGKRKWYGGGAMPDRWIGMTPNQDRSGVGHPCEKPLEPMKMLVSALSPLGGIIFDPFMGSATTGEAALRLGRKFIGIDNNPDYFTIAERRMRRTAGILPKIRAGIRTNPSDLFP